MKKRKNITISQKIEFLASCFSISPNAVFTNVLNKKRNYKTMIAIVTIGEKKKIVEGESIDELLNSAKWLLNDPLEQVNECTLTVCTVTENITIKKPKK